MKPLIINIKSEFATVRTYVNSPQGLVCAEPGDIIITTSFESGRVIARDVMWLELKLVKATPIAPRL